MSFAPGALDDDYGDVRLGSGTTGIYGYGVYSYEDWIGSILPHIIRSGFGHRPRLGPSIPAARAQPAAPPQLPTVDTHPVGDGQDDAVTWDDLRHTEPWIYEQIEAPADEPRRGDEEEGDFGYAWPRDDDAGPSPVILPPGVQPPITDEAEAGEQMATTWTDIFGTIAEGYFNPPSLLPPSVTPAVQPGTHPAYPGLPVGTTINAQGRLVKCRRRRKRLLTPTDLSDLAALKTIVGNSDALKFAVTKAVRR